MKRSILSRPLLPCSMDTGDCFARNEKGKCTCLEIMDFGGQHCPFQKPTAQNERECEAALQRLRKLGRDDLIEKYRQGLSDTMKGMKKT